MSYKRKYRMGERITSLDELVQQQWVYLFPKPTGIKHIGWILSMQFGNVKRFLDVGIYKAIPTNLEENADGN